MWPAADLREIRVFLVLAEELHFGRTGERLRLTPSRVSQMIRTLEARLGGSLFDRTSRRVRLTPLGERLRDQITPAYEQLERAFHETRNAATGIAGTLRTRKERPPNHSQRKPRAASSGSRSSSRASWCRFNSICNGSNSACPARPSTCRRTNSS